jgi:hypothetical protein
MMHFTISFRNIATTINELMRNETILTYSVNKERTKGWIVLNADAKQDVDQIMEQTPIHPFINFQVEELFIFDSMIGTLKMVLN